MEFLSEISWSRVLLPARLAGVAALGVMVGALAVNQGWLGSRTSPGWGHVGVSQSTAQHAGNRSAAGALIGGSLPDGRLVDGRLADGLADASNRVPRDRPFADLARKLQSSRSSSSSDSLSRETNDVLLPQYQLNDAQSMGRTVHLDQPDGRPQIIF